MLRHGLAPKTCCHVHGNTEVLILSDKEDDYRPNAMSLRALITPVVAVLLVLAGVVLSVLLTGTSIQNDAEVARSQRQIDSAFKLVGRDLGRVSVTLARLAEADGNLARDFDRAWADEHLSVVESGFGPVAAIVVGGDDSVIYRSRTAGDAAVSPTIRGIVADARKLPAVESWTSAFVIHDGRLHVAAASTIARAGADNASRPALVVLRDVDETLLARLSSDFLIQDIEVQPPSDIQATVGIVIRSPGGENLAAITWTPARPGDELFDYLLVPIVIASLIAALLLATFLRTAVRAAQQLKRGAVALAESGEALEHSETMLSAIIHGVADGIVSIDESGRIVSANASMARIFGYEPGEMLGEPADMLIADAKGGEDEPAAPALIAHPDVVETEYREFTGRRKDGGRFVLDTAISHTTHQSQAVAIAIMRDVTERRQAEETLNLLSTGMALVDRDCRLLLANRSASRLLDSGDGLMLSHGRITAARREQVDHLRDLVDGVCTGMGVEEDEGAGVMTIDRGDSVRPLSIKVAPVQLNSSDDGSKVAAVFIRDLEIRQSVPPEVVAKLFGLTFAEARVVAELVKGKRPQEVAEDLGVSLNTVRNQLKQIFSKTNTGRQSELISLVLSSAAFVSEHGLEIEDSDDPDIQLTGS
jgi:PAS domain S-box-containing protein